jgi:formamidopyrimidine-DNA glycosylase
MPELPEIETLSRELQGITNTVITEIHFANVNLRYPLDQSLKPIEYKKIVKIFRRAKYLIFQLSEGFLIIHLGMSGRLLLVNQDCVLSKHDHVIVHLNNAKSLRYNDPRRFGCVIYKPDLTCLEHLALEPFDQKFNPQYLHQALKKKSTAIKNSILNGSIVVGVGNIYVSESLFLSKIHPLRPSHSISLSECYILVDSIRKVLNIAINSKGSSLRDFVNISGAKGHATSNLLIYGKSGLACANNCNSTIKALKICGRNTFYCDLCQK